MKQNWERQENMKKENNTDESDFSETEMPDLMEAATRGVLLKIMFLEISPNL